MRTLAISKKSTKRIATRQAYLSYDVCCTYPHHVADECHVLCQ